MVTADEARYLRRLRTGVIVTMVLVVSAFLVFKYVVPYFQSEIKKENIRQRELYFDDGKGLVFVYNQGNRSEDIYKALQAWRDKHPDRFKRISSALVSSYWENAIISYLPADSVFTVKESK